MKQLLILISLMITISIQAQVKQGVASYYHDSLDGNLTANGEIYKKDEISCAHKTLPFGTVLLVTNKDNNKKVVVRVNDRGPFVEGRDIDLSKSAAELIGMVKKGVVKIEYEIVNDLYDLICKNVNKFDTKIF